MAQAAPKPTGRPRSDNHDSVVRLAESGLSNPQIGDRLGLSASRVANILTEERRNGRTVERPDKGPSIKDINKQNSEPAFAWSNIRTTGFVRPKHPKPPACTDGPHSWQLDSKNHGYCPKCRQEWQFQPVPWGVAG